jgi:hypothetical protein
MEITFSEYGNILKKKNITVSTSYGSGGFCVTLLHLDTERVYGGYSLDINQAFEAALKKLENDRYDVDDLPTNPGIVKKKM